MCCTQLFSLSANAEHLEITSLVGYTFSPKLTSYDRTTEIATTNEPNIALAFSWQGSKAGQGQILVNYISRDFTNDVDQSTHSFDTIYTHFNGVAFFRDKNYITTVSMGIGATYFDSDFDSAIYPSITINLDTRYEFSDNLAFCNLNKR